MLLFLSILKSALWQTEDIPCRNFSEEEMDNLLTLAQKQTVSALVIDVLIRSKVKMPRQLLLKAFGRQSRIQRRNTQVDEGVVKLHNLFEEANINYRVVKGQVVGSYYPNPQLRQSGDIDYYCDAQNYKKSLEVIRKVWRIEPKVEDSEKHANFNLDGIIYEGHFALTTFYNKRKDDYWKRLIEEDCGVTVTISSAGIKTLSPTLHVLFVFLHLYHHLMELGIGIRQFCDWAVILHYGKHEIDHHQLHLHLKVLGMDKAYCACGSILTNCLGLPEQEFGFSISKRDRRYGKKVLSVVFYRGNMGHYNKHNGFKGWKHQLEATIIKISHFLKFMPLAPDYSCRWLWHEFLRKVWRKL